MCSSWVCNKFVFGKGFSYLKFLEEASTNLNITTQCTWHNLTGQKVNHNWRSASTTQKSTSKYSACHNNFLHANKIHEIFNPGIFNPGIFKLGIFILGIFKLGIFNPAIFKPGILKLGIFNPAIFKHGMFYHGIFKHAKICSSNFLTCNIFTLGIFTPATKKILQFYCKNSSNFHSCRAKSLAIFQHPIFAHAHKNLAIFMLPLWCILCSLCCSWWIGCLACCLNGFK